jgi:hypothetical protein
MERRRKCTGEKWACRSKNDGLLDGLPDGGPPTRTLLVLFVVVVPRRPCELLKMLPKNEVYQHDLLLQYINLLVVLKLFYRVSRVTDNHCFCWTRSRIGSR